MIQESQLCCSMSPGRLITTDGTILSQAVCFANGNMIVRYSVGCDDLSLSREPVSQTWSEEFSFPV